MVDDLLGGGADQKCADARLPARPKDHEIDIGSVQVIDEPPAQVGTFDDAGRNLVSADLCDDFFRKFIQLMLLLEQ